MADLAPWQDRDPNNDDEDDDVDENAFKDQKDAVLCLIRVSPSMLEVNSENGESDLKYSLEVAYHAILDRIISQPHDMFGILLFGTEKTKVEGNYAHLYTLMDLDVPDAADIKELKRLINDKNALEALCKPSKDGGSMANVLFAANIILTSKAARFGSRRVWLFTDEDEPGTKEAQKSAITRARDLNDLGIRMEFRFFDKPGKPPFDRTKFYDDIFYKGDEEEGDYDDWRVPLDPVTRKESLLTWVRSKQTPKRSQFNILMELGPGMEIGIKGFILFKRQEAQRSHYVYAQEEKLAIAHVESADIDPVIQKEDVQKAFKFGGEHIVFSQDELKHIRSFGEPVLRILGFKPIDKLRFWDNIRPSYFIYPSDATVTGSTRTFASLHKKLLKDELMGIGWFIPRRNQAPSFVAILPQEEEVDEKGVQIVPAGMHCVQLPTLDDIRANPIDKTVRAPDELMDLMGRVITTVTLKKYDPSKYPNPGLQWHYRILQAIALEEELPEKPEDKTIPKYSQIHKRAGEFALEWGQTLDQVEPAGRIEPEEKPAKKRKRIGNVQEDGDVMKPVKKEKKSGDPVSGDRIESLYEQGMLMTLKLDQLKEACAVRGIVPGRTKQACVDALEEFLSKS